MINLKKQAETNNINLQVKNFNNELYAQSLHDPIQTHAIYGGRAEDAENIKDFLKKRFKATRFRLAKNSHGFVTVCFKFNAFV